MGSAKPFDPSSVFGSSQHPLGANTLLPKGSWDRAGPPGLVTQLGSDGAGSSTQDLWPLGSVSPPLSQWQLWRSGSVESCPVPWALEPECLQVLLEALVL